MRVHVHPADEGGCGYYRLRWATEYLIAQGADVALGAGIQGVYQDDDDGRRGCWAWSIPAVTWWCSSV